MIESEIIGERKVWAAVITRAKQDLISPDNRLALKAAFYFFTENDSDNNDDDLRTKTFNNVCKAHNLDPEKAAKKIWSGLSLEQRDRIKYLLQKSGFEVLTN